MRSAALFTVLFVACASEEATRLTLPVRVDSSRLSPVENDLGWTVTLHEARLVMDRLELTIAGEAHARNETPLDALRDFFLGRARAHPGHLADGDVGGELVGPLLVSWGEASTSTAELGLATLFEGDYEGANLRLGIATKDHGLGDGDPLLGQGAHVVGEATRLGRTIPFEAQLALPEPPLIVGLPFVLRVTEASTTTLGLAVSCTDDTDGQTLFDGIDFGALADLEALPDGDTLTLRDAANNRLRRAFFTHDFFSLTTSETR